MAWRPPHNRIMLSPTSPIFSTLHDISSRALARHELSVSKALDKTEELPRRMGEDNSGQYVYSSRLQSEVRQSKAMSSNLQNTLSHYQIQEGFLDSALDRYSHMSMLAMKASDPLISELERARLNEEFDTIRKDLLNFSTEEVNGNDVFREAKKYELVNKEANLNWTDAKAEADARDQADPINDHYLSTITSEYEQDVISFQIGQVGINAWLGGNDTAVEGEWRWTEGPEGLEDSGNGRLFWQGKSSGSAVGGAYENWGNNEPNNAGNEDYLQISQAVQPDGSVGKWNDLRNTNSSGATYQPRGYVLETDQGKLLGVMPQSNIQLENVSLVPFYSSNYINLEDIEAAVDAQSKLESTMEILQGQKGNIASNVSQLEMGIDRLNRQIAAAEFSFARMSDEEMIEDLTKVARTQLLSDASMSVMMQARGINRNLTEVLL